MKEQYYTPTIDEFHVGFEFEVFTVSNEWKKLSWDFQFDLKDAIERDRVRVKCIDRQDAEELGFVMDPLPHEKYTASFYFANKGNFNLWISECNAEELRERWGFITPYYNVYIRRFLVPYEEAKSSFDWQDIFKGWIKNKSELKRLIKQLGLNDN